MISLYDYLLSIGYSCYDAEETCIRFDYGFPLPEKIREDVKKWVDFDIKERLERLSKIKKVVI